MGRIDGRVAYVTGAASGIGRAAAIALAREGAAIFVTDIDDDGGAATVAAIAAAGGRAAYRRQNVTEEARWAELVTECLALFGRIDILVNNAGIGTSGLITDLSLEKWNHQMAVNVTSVFLGTKHVLPALRAARPDGRVGGSIVNISSVAGLGGSAACPRIARSKGAVRLMTKAVAMECATMKDGVRCNSVHPGIIDTPIWTKLDDGAVLAAAAGGAEGANALDPAAIALAAPLGYPGTPENIADGIVFLACDDSRYMTGAELVIDGGWTAH